MALDTNTLCKSDQNLKYTSVYKQHPGRGYISDKNTVYSQKFMVYSTLVVKIWVWKVCKFKVNLENI